MNCRKVTHLLSAYMDGELPGVEHRLIHEHLGHCEDCLADYEDLLQMKRLLGRLRMQAAHRNLPVQILQQIASEEARADAARSVDWRNVFLQRLRTGLRTPQTVSLGLGCAVVAMLYMAQFNLSAQQPNAITATWQQSPPTVHEFINGITYADSGHFLSRPSGAAYRNSSSNGLFNQREAELFQRRSSSVQLEQIGFHPQ